jgi:hypothetical protein
MKPLDRFAGGVLDVSPLKNWGPIFLPLSVRWNDVDAAVLRRIGLMESDLRFAGQVGIITLTKQTTGYRLGA